MADRSADLCLTAIGDIAILEGWPLGEMMQLFPDSPDLQRYWSRKIQFFSLFDNNGKYSSKWFCGKLALTPSSCHSGRIQEDSQNSDT